MSGSCMECEVKDAEIHILRKRIQKLQDQIEQVTLPNGGGDSVQSHAPSGPSPPEELKLVCTHFPTWSIM